MPKRSDFSVTRWVLMNEKGEFSLDQYGGKFERGLDTAHIFIARPEQTIAVKPVEVIVTLAGHQDRMR